MRLLWLVVGLVVGIAAARNAPAMAAPVWTTCLLLTALCCWLAFRLARRDRATAIASAVASAVAVARAEAKAEADAKAAAIAQAAVHLNLMLGDGDSAAALAVRAERLREAAAARPPAAAVAGGSLDPELRSPAAARPVGWDGFSRPE